MNILVLGSEGQIGKPLCEHLQKRGHILTRWDKKLGWNYDLATRDNMSRLKKAVQSTDKVIFLAFEVGGSKFLSNMDKTHWYIERNVKLMDNTFEVLSNYRRPFLFTSSQMSNMHHTNYGFLKDLGERYTRVLNGWICRFWNVYGKEDCESDKKHVITDFIDMAKKNGVIKMRTKGIEKRQFLHTDDSSKAITQWAEDIWSDNSQYYDITSFEWETIENVALIIAKKLGAKVKFGSDTDNIQCGITNNPSEYIKRFWTPEISLSEGIDKLLV